MANENKIVERTSSAIAQQYLYRTGYSPEYVDSHTDFFAAEYTTLISAQDMKGNAINSGAATKFEIFSGDLNGKYHIATFRVVGGFPKDDNVSVPIVKRISDWEFYDVPALIAKRRAWDDRDKNPPVVNSEPDPDLTATEVIKRGPGRPRKEAA